MVWKMNLDQHKYILILYAIYLVHVSGESEIIQLTCEKTLQLFERSVLAWGVPLCI